MDIKRGNIHYIDIPNAIGHEMMKDRPGVIISYDPMNYTSTVVSVVFLTGSRPEDEYDCQKFGKEVECKYRSKKPEGIAVELADCIIRILDWYGKEGLDTDALLLEAGIITMCDLPTPVYGSFGDFIALLHNLLSMAYACWCNASGTSASALRLAKCIREIMAWAKENGVDMEMVLDTKHEYNKGRPYRHGGKAL